MLVLGEKFIHLHQNGPLPQGVRSLQKGSKLKRIRALVLLSLEESARVRNERIVPSRMVLVENFDDDGNRFVKARLTATGDQDPELVIASLGADVELGDVTGAFLESAELNRQGGKHFVRQPSGGLPGLHYQHGLNDSPKRWFLEVFPISFGTLAGNLPLWMNVSSFSLIRNPRF